MRVAFRVDASRTMGAGHVSRCLTLADALAARGATVCFVSRRLSGNLNDQIRARGHGLAELAEPTGQVRLAEDDPAHAPWLEVDWRQDAEETARALGPHPWDWLVVDHYALDHRWAARLGDRVHQRLVIDDLADRRLDCDVLFCQSLAPQEAARLFEPLVPAGCQRLFGGEVALLRPEFRRAQRAAVRRRQAADPAAQKTIFITNGLYDVGNLLLPVVTALSTQGWRLLVAVGAKAGVVPALQDLAAGNPHLELHLDAPRVADLMGEADLAIGAGGVSAFERCALGLPSLLHPVAENQWGVARTLQEAGAVRLLERSVIEDAPLLRARVQGLLTDPAGLDAMSRAGLAICDGHGADRVCDVLYGDHAVQALRGDGETPGPRAGKAGLRRLRPLQADDGDRLLAWRNQPAIRAVSFDTQEIPLDQHRAWFAKKMSDTDPAAFIYEVGGRPLGFVQAHPADPDVWEWGFYIGEADAPKGSGTAMLFLMLEHLFFVRQARTVLGQAKPGNVASLRLHSRFGFNENRGARDGDPVLFTLEQGYWRTVRGDIIRKLFP